MALSLRRPRSHAGQKLVKALTLGIFCGFVVLSGATLTRAQEYILDNGPMPDSVDKLNGALDLPFLALAPFPWLLQTVRDRVRDTLRPYLKDLPPFFRDSKITMKVRSFYFNRDIREPGPNSANEAFTLGGSLSYESGWVHDFFSGGLEFFTSQRLYAPDNRDGTLLLRPGQVSYSVLGRAYAKFKYKQYTATLYRQYLRLPYVNKQDNRMTPNTFEAYQLEGKFKLVQFIAGYVRKIKPRNSSGFLSMSERAGATGGRDRGMGMAGFRLTPIKAGSFGVINYYVPDTLNILYTEADYTWEVTKKFGVKLQGQFTDQRSVGGDDLIGKFDTRVGGAQLALSYDDILLRAAFSVTASGAAIQSPYGSYPGYLSLIEKNFYRAGEKAWLLGLSYDAEKLIRGVAFTFNFARGVGARDADTRSSLPDQTEYDITVDYRPDIGLLRGLWFRIRNAYVDFSDDGGSTNNFRFIVNYELGLL